MSQDNLKRGRGVFKVFVSSTFRDLKDEREEIRKIIDCINLESIGMESFVPSERDAHETSLDKLKESDIYLLFIGEKYGSKIKECKIKCNLKNSVCNGKISFTHCEYRTAGNLGMLPICFRLSYNKKLEEDLKKFKEEVENKFYLKPIKKENLKDEVENALKENIIRWVSEGKLNLPDFYGRTEEIKELLDSDASTIFIKGIGGIGKTTLIEAFLLVKKIEGANILEIVKERDYDRTDIGYRYARDALERREYKALDLRGLAEILGIPSQTDDKMIVQSIIYDLNNRNLILFIDDVQEIKDERVFKLIGRCTNSLTKGKIILAGRETLKTHVEKSVQIKKGVEDEEFIKSIFIANDIEEKWNKKLSDKIMKLTSAHPLAVKLVVGNLDHINLDSFTKALENPYDEKQAEQFIGRITMEILGTDFEKITHLSVHRIPFPLDNSEAKKLVGKMILEKTNGEFFFNYDLIHEVLYASIKDKKQAHKEASDYYKKFEGSNNYKGIAEYLYHLAKSRDKDAYDKYLNYYDILGKQGFYRELIDINEVLLECVKGDKGKESACYTNLGVAYFGLGDFKKAIEYYEKALEIKLGIEDKAGESTCYMNLGVAYGSLGDFKKAVEYFEKALKIALEIGNKAGESTCYGNLGNAYRVLGDFKKAVEYFEKSLEIALEIGNKAGESTCYMDLGSVYDCLGDFKKAIEYHKKSLKIALEIGNKAGESGCYQCLGVDYRDLGDFKKAIEYFEKSLEIFLGIGNKEIVSRCCRDLGVAYLHLGDFKKAVEYFEKSLEIALEKGDKTHEAACYSNLGIAYDCLGDFKKAIQYLENSLKIDKVIGDKAGESICYMNLGNVYDDLGDFKKAVEFYLKAEKIFKEIGQKHYLKILYKNMANAYGEMNNPEKAEEYRKLYENF